MISVLALRAISRVRAGCSQGGSVAEGDGDVAMQLGLVRLHDEQVVALGVPHMAADLALGEDGVAGDERAFERSPLRSVSAAVISLASGGTTRSPITAPSSVAKAESTCSGAASSRRLPRSVLPSSAMCPPVASPRA